MQNGGLSQGILAPAPWAVAGWPMANRCHLGVVVLAVEERAMQERTVSAQEHQGTSPLAQALGQALGQSVQPSVLLAPAGAALQQPSWLRHPPRQWRPDTLDREALYACAREIRGHPRFPLARRRFAANMLSAYESHPPLARLMRTEDQLAFQAFVLMLHHRRDPADPDSGPTYSRLCEFYGVGDVASRTVVKKLLALNKLRGHLQVLPGTRGRRRIVPTESLLSTMGVWFGANLAAVECLEPLPRPAAQLGARADLLCEVLSYGVCAYLHSGFVLSLDYPEVRAFMAREQGYLVLMALAESMSHEPALPTGSVAARAPSLALGQRLGVSRGTVRNLLNMALQQGWVLSIGRGGHDVMLSPGFAQRCTEWMSLELAWMSGMVQAACRALETEPPRAG